jgi:hypothetical protein
MDANRFAFIPGSYTRLRNPIRVEGINASIHVYGLV